MAKQLNIGNTTSPVDVNITESLKINGKTAVVSSSESLGESTRPLYLENGELLAGSQQYIFWEEDNGANPTGSNPYVLKAGDTMTGPLILSGNPSLALAAVPKQYVDGNFLTNTDALNLFYTKEGSNSKFMAKADYENKYLLLTGGTMSGYFHITKNNPDISLNNTSDDSYSIIRLGKNGGPKGIIFVNGSNRTEDGGANMMTIRNDAGEIRLDSVTRATRQFYGAVWNDYAEYRQGDCIEPGKCVIETGIDTLTISTKRLQPGASIISDTFGFAIGETDQAKTPIAVSGRVLAYTWEDREIYRDHIGEFVCSGPQGTVSLMTTEEYHKYPHCAIGTVSSVPDYEEWGTGNVKINGRVWIKIL